MSARFRSLIRRWLRPPRYLRFTRFGAFAVSITFGIGFAAMNTGNNLVYMIFGMMLGCITASGVISEICLRHLETDWLLPGECHAGRPAPIRLIIRNTKLRLPSLALRARVKISCREENRSFQSFFPCIPALAQRSFDISFRPERRGRHRIEELRIETLFPFGFFQKYWVRDCGETFLVYPRTEKLDREIFSSRPRGKPRPAGSAGWGDSFRGLREFQEGDNPRLISWKSSARLSRLMLKEMERESEKSALFEMGEMREWEALRQKGLLEEAVSFAASLILSKSEGGYAVGLAAGGFFCPPSASRRNLASILSYLALFDPDGKEALPRGTSGFRRLPQLSPERVADWESIPILELWERRAKRGDAPA